MEEPGGLRAGDSSFFESFFDVPGAVGTLGLRRIFRRWLVIEGKVIGFPLRGVEVRTVDEKRTVERVGRLEFGILFHARVGQGDAGDVVSAQCSKDPYSRDF